tara:strand:+ start:1034 stop:1336 length:303 start_codon:yes stop_codon:yes gene_type:complete
MNYVEDGYVIDELTNIHRKGHDIEVDWLIHRFKPENLASSRIKKSIGYWGASLCDHMASQRVELERIKSLHFVWPAGQRMFMLAVDDRKKEHKIYVNKLK